MEKKRKILFIINPISGVGNKKEILPLVEKHIDGCDCEWKISYTEKRNHGFEIAQKEHPNYDAIVAVGGDGSVNEIGSALIGTDCALGIIPYGSGNGLARHLKIPLGAEKAIERIANYNREKIDTGTVNGIPFLGTCGFGFDAHVAHKFDTFGQRGFISYVRLVTSEYNSYKESYFKVNGKNLKIEKNAILCSIANSSQFGNGFTISPNSDIQDGVFELIFLERFNMIKAPFVTGKFFTRSIHTSPHFSSTTFREEIEIEVVRQNKTEDFYFHIDGEPIKGDDLFRIKIIPQSLYVI